MGKRYKTKERPQSSERIKRNNEHYNNDIIFDEDDIPKKVKKATPPMRKTSSKQVSRGTGKIRIKPVVVTSVIALLLALLAIEFYYIAEKRIGTKLIHNNDSFAIHETEDGHKVFPVDFVFKSASNTDITLSKILNGKENIILNFFNSTTKSCIDVFKETEALQKQLPDTVIINVDVGDDINVTKKYLKDNNITANPENVLLDLNMKIFKGLGYETMPVMTVIDDDGTILGTINDAMTADEIKGSFESIIKADNATGESSEETNLDGVLE